MGKMTVAQAMVEVLKRQGIDIIFGLPGGSIYPFYNALYDSGIRHILVRQEQAAAHEANAYARVTGKVGVCVVTSGPGATNLITGIATAYMDSVPIVAITGQVNTKLIGKDSFQEIDVVGATAPFTKHNYLVKDPKSIVRVMREAFYIASTKRPGPVVIDVPIDIQLQEIDFDYSGEIAVRGYKIIDDLDLSLIDQCVEAVESSKRPILCAGGGVILSKASEQLKQFVEKLKMPVVSTLMGVGCVPTNHPYYLGVAGLFGTSKANMALKQADLVIVVGARFSERTLAGAKINDNIRIIHIDIDPAEIDKNINSDIGIVGDAKAVLAEINKRLKNPKSKRFWAEELNNTQEYRFEDDKLHPQDVLSEISRVYDGNYIITTDVGQHQIWAAHNLFIKEPGTFITSGGLGTMGFGLPAAIGAKLGRPDKEVILITSDGSFQMLFQELATIRREQLPIKIVLFNNSRLGMVYELQKQKCNARFVATCLDGNPDFVLLAKAYGIESHRISEKHEVKLAIQKMKEASSPFLLEVIIDPDEPSIPSRPNIWN